MNVGFDCKLCTVLKEIGRCADALMEGMGEVKTEEEREVRGDCKGSDR